MNDDSESLTGDIREFWNLDFDPFTREAPSFATLEYTKVQTESIKKMNDILVQFGKDREGRTIVLKGNRGIGKSFAIKYLRLLLDRQHHFVVFCNITHSDPTSAADIKSYVHKQILLELITTAALNETASQILDFRHLKDELSSNDVSRIEAAIFYSLNTLSPSFPKFFLIIDDLDKIEYQQWDLLTKYLADSQGFYSKLKTSEMPGKHYTSYVLIAMQPNQLADTRRARELQYFNDMPYTIQDWNLDEVVELIDKKIHLACNLTKYQLSFYFDQDVVKEIYERNDHNPRFCQTACRALLIEGAHQKTKPIKWAFAKDHPELLKGFVGVELQSKLDSALALVSTKYPVAHKRIKDLQRLSPGAWPSNLREMLHVYSEAQVPHSGRYDPLRDTTVIINVRDARNETVYELANEVNIYIRELLDFFKGDADAVRLFFLREF